MDAEGWIRDYYRCLDKKDIDASIGYWWPDAVLRFADAEPAVGQHAVRAALTAMVNAVASTTHRPLQFVCPGGHVALQAPFTHVSPVAQLWLQAPQLRTAVSRFTHCRSHCVVPVPHDV